MDLVLTFLGIIISTVLPIVIAYWQSRRNQIFYVEETSVNIYDDLVKSFDEISIKYNGESIKDKFYLIKGFLFFNGNNDIKKEDQTKPFSISLVKGGKWHNIKILQAQNEMDAHFEIDSEKASLIIPLIKMEDFLRFEGLYEANDSSLTFNHRIANVPNRVNRISLSDFKKTKSNRWFYMIIFIVMLGCNFNILNNVESYSLTPRYKVNSKIVNIDSIQQKKELLRKDINELTSKKIFDTNLVRLKYKEYEDLTTTLNYSREYEIRDSIASTLNKVSALRDIRWYRLNEKLYISFIYKFSWYDALPISMLLFILVPLYYSFKQFFIYRYAVTQLNKITSKE